MGGLSETGGGGGSIPGPVTQRQYLTARNAAIVGIGVGVVGIGLSIFALTQNFRLNQKAELMSQQIAGDSTKIAVVDSSRIADSTRNEQKFVLLKDNLAAVDKSAAKVLAVDTLKGRVGVLENRADKTDSAIAAIDSAVIRIQKTIDDLAGTDDSLKAQLRIVARHADGVDVSLARLSIYIELRHTIDAWNTNRGGFLFFGGRKKLPQISGGEFDIKKGHIFAPLTYEEVKDLAGNVFLKWATEHGVKPEEAEKWLSQQWG